ncbi:putative RNA-directed DNA polymerase, eukaryota, reverse transcriptase zinc-binding domain protein [Tanacetum coccineum]
MTLKSPTTFASVLINGSPTKKFKLEKSIHQGDPLSPFLFILAVEALNVALIEATNNNFFNGIKVGKDKIQVSHLQFTDDTLGDWSLSNAKNLSRILTCFHLASGLKVNFNKSKLFGIRVSNEELNVIASSNGCLASQFPSTYLGLPIGAKNVIDVVIGILSLKDSKNVFLNGKLATYLLEVGLGKVLLPLNKGGLRIGSLLASNQSLLAKWWWRFRNEDSSLWCKVIRSIHGPSGGVLNPYTHKKAAGTWSQIINLKGDLSKVDINLPMLFKRKIGDEENKLNL